jgi:hypothetical protein
MSAELVARERLWLTEEIMVEIVIWRLPRTSPAAATPSNTGWRSWCGAFACSATTTKRAKATTSTSMSARFRIASPT